MLSPQRRLNVVLAFEPAGAYRSVMSESDRDSKHALDPDGQRVFMEALGRLGPVLLGGLDGLEQAFRRLHPPDFPNLRAGLAPIRGALDEALVEFDEVQTPPALEKFCTRLVSSARLTSDALAGLVDSGPPSQGPARALRAMHDHARAQAQIYPLRDVLAPVSAFFAEPYRRDDLDSLEARPESEERVGLFRSGEVEARGGFDLYVPESYDGSEAWPLVVALHGGSGNGADFLWSWLREARSRRFILLSPTSRDSTWSLQAPLVDGQVLCQMVDWVRTKWNVEGERILLTGLSDGATMTLLVGLGADTPFTHLAPVSGVLHPMNFANGNLDRARDRPIYLVHGALDWMFPVSLAQEAANVLRDANAELVYREIEDLSHTYPREENGRIIEWFDPRRVASSPNDGS
jgi:phospholipase/carboxylesterase